MIRYVGNSFCTKNPVIYNYRGTYITQSGIESSKLVRELHMLFAQCIVNYDSYWHCMLHCN